MSTLLDSDQVIQHVYDDSNEALTIVGTGTGGAVPVTLSTASGSDVLQTLNISYTNLTTSYYEAVASLADDISKIAIYDTSGETIELAIGASGAEVVRLTIGPGCDQQLDVALSIGDRIAVRTVGSNATSGSLILNLIGVP
jgi:hypothetical protein